MPVLAEGINRQAKKACLCREKARETQKDCTPAGPPAWGEGWHPRQGAWDLESGCRWYRSRLAQPPANGCQPGRVGRATENKRPHAHARWHPL